MNVNWDRAKLLFAEVLEQPPSRQRSYIAAQCVGDDDLAEWVMQLLENHLALADHTLIPALDLLAASKSDDAENVGARVGVWRITSVLGHGGMGTVYAVDRDDGVVVQQAALKLMRSQWLDRNAPHRLRAERQILASLDHPYIARLIDAGEDQFGAPYYVMDRIDGIPITDYCARHDLTVEARLKQFLRVCKAIRHAHQSLVVHLDIKPGNVLVDRAGIPKVLDFGIARSLKVSASDAKEAARAFSPAYAAPEYVASGTVTTRCDVFSLGVLLCAMLGGTTRLAEQDARTAARKRLSVDLAAIIERATAADPEQRYASVDALADDVRRHQAHRPVIARAQGVGYRLGRFMRRNRLAVGLSVVLGVSVVGSAIGLGLLSVRLANERDVARDNLAQANAVTDYLVEIFKAADPTESLGETIPAAAVLRHGAQRLESGLIAERGVRKRLLHAMSDVFMSMGLYAEAEPLVDEWLLLADRDEPMGQGGALEARARLLSAQGQHAAALSISEKAVATLVDGPPDQAASALVTKARILARLDRRTDAIAVYRQAIDRFENQQLRLATQRDLATVLASTGRNEEAIALVGACLDGQRAVLPANHPEIAATLMLKAKIERRYFHDYKLARVSALAAEVIYRDVYRDDHLIIGSMNITIGAIEHALGNAEAAIDRLEQSLKIFARHHGDDHPDIAKTRFNLGVIQKEQGLHDAARTNLAAALVTAQAVWGDQHTNTNLFRLGNAELQIEAGDLDQAETLLQAALGHFKARPTRRGLNVAYTQALLGAVAVGREQRSEALAWLEPSVPILKEHLAPDNADLVRAQANLRAARLLGG